MGDDKRLIYSSRDIKEILHAGNSTLHELLNREDDPIPHFRLGRRIIVPCDQFQEWLIKQTTNAQGDSDATLHN